MDDVGYKYTASYANIVKESLNGTAPEVFDRMNRYKSEYGVELEWPLHDLRELVWPKDLDENELKFKRGQRIKYRNDPLFVPQYYVWHYSVKEKKPQLAKEVRLYSQ